MRITRLEAENFKRLRAVDITPDENTVVIAGRNAQGKSSVLDAIMAALAGRSGAKKWPRPIRDGENKARVVVELDDLRIERKWTASGSTVTVGPKDGKAKLNSPQAVLDKLIGALAFDPLAFAESEPKKQVATLIDLIGREKFDDLADRRRSAYDERTDINRQVKSIRTRREALGVVEPVEPVDAGAVADELDVARRKTRLLDEWAKLRARMDEVEAEGRALPTTRAVEALVDLLGTATTLNERARRYDDAVTLDEELVGVEGESERLSSLVDGLDSERSDLIANADLPVEGLTFDEDGISFNGVPFVQSSAAERLKVSVAMAMAMNPELRVICIRDASLLDNDSKRALIDMATEHDYQIFYEVVGDGGDVGVIIEDGMVQS